MSHITIERLPNQTWRVSVRDDERNLTDIWESASVRLLLQFVVKRLLGVKFGIRKVRK